jgi:hypothetical protein
MTVVGRWQAPGAAWLLVALAAGMLGACAPSATTTVHGDPGLPPSLTALAGAGSRATEAASGTLTSAFGCELRFEDHRPVDGTEGATVVIAPGFLRSLDSMRGWAQHLASHGVRTVVVGFCNSTPFAGRHDRNAIDLRAVADALQPADAAVVYAGFSAGGLAALLAAEDDPRAVAYLGLDAVDSDGLAARAAGFDRPALFLTAESGPCNARGNMTPTAASMLGARVQRLPNATHCHFEDPYAPPCERLCGRVEPGPVADAIRATIRALATAWVLEHAGSP